MNYSPVASAERLTFADDISEASRQAVREVLAKLEAPGLDGAVAVKRLDGGGSNENFVVTTGEAKMALRVAGQLTDRFLFDRPRGLDAHRHAYATGYAPRLYASVLPEGHCLSAFVPGRTLTTEILAEDNILELCTEALLKVHHAQPIGGRRFSMFEDTQTWIDVARTEGLELPDDIDAVCSMLRQVEGIFDSLDIPDLLCHNDLQVQNYLVEPDKAWLVDWEYGAMGNPYSDLAMLVHYGEVGRDGAERIFTAYLGAARSCDHARSLLMYFGAAARDAAWSVIAEPVLGPVTGYDYAAWGTRFFGEIAELIDSEDFRSALDVAGPALDDADLFADAARRATA
ncbi:phosphotransferase [Nocardioides sp. NPDC006303]|uniref:phosphotransferase n=1 Tax=Nocardioides sp. NPDC006303 TaxID=3156747 RepID=UPI0033A7D4EC